jgi:hypothetical protein
MESCTVQRSRSSAQQVDEMTSRATSCSSLGERVSECDKTRPELANGARKRVKVFVLHVLNSRDYLFDLTPKRQILLSNFD